MMITLAGGKQILDFVNRKCRICGKEMHGSVLCRKEKGNICQEHCGDCKWYIPYLQRCRYREEEKK